MLTNKMKRHKGLNKLDTVGANNYRRRKKKL